VVVGYRTYLDLIRPLLAGREVLAGAMKQELERGRLALTRARAGDRVAVVSGGDVGVYGMAGLILELAAAWGLKVAPPGDPRPVDLYLEIIPGMPALTAAAALLGAPLMHDFCAISLSDLLTPWEVIEKRVRAAVAADFVVALYNPQSKKRHWQLAAVRELLLERRAPETPVGIVRRAMREGQEVILTTLGEMLNHPVDMQTLIIVGNSQSFVYEGYFITPRGYLTKYQPPAAEGAP